MNTLIEITCDCSVTDLCPEGKMGSQRRCTILINPPAKDETEIWKERCLIALQYVPDNVTIGELKKLRDDVIYITDAEITRLEGIRMGLMRAVHDVIDPTLKYLHGARKK